MACGLWPMACGLWPVACGLWPVACGLWPVACGLWPVACGLWPVACGLWPVACLDADFLAQARHDRAGRRRLAHPARQGLGGVGLAVDDEGVLQRPGMR